MKSVLHQIMDIYIYMDGDFSSSQKYVDKCNVDI